jgi:hypothetical protein
MRLLYTACGAWVIGTGGDVCADEINTNSTLAEEYSANTNVRACEGICLYRVLDVLSLPRFAMFEGLHSRTAVSHHLNDLYRQGAATAPILVSCPSGLHVVVIVSSCAMLP